MSYIKEIPFRDYVLEVTYNYNRYPECLGLSNWAAYISDNEVEIPCVVESEYIEDKLLEWLDKEFSLNREFYREEYLANLGEKKYNLVEEK